MTSVGPRHNKLSQLVSYHILGNINRNMLSSVLYCYGMPHKRMEDRLAARPGIDYFLFARIVHCVNLLQKTLVCERSFFY